MNKKITFRVIIAIALYGIFAAGVMHFYKDTPVKMEWDEREGFNRQYIAKLKLDVVNVDKVILDIGSPDITEAKKVDSGNFQVMFYRTQHKHSDGITTQDECTALLFKNDVLVGIGESAYLDYKELKATE
ncbi:cell envelope protein SmpA [Thalassotalea sp. 42_200_T64]|nr:cell envelope protein SmpA [Thalassotalea sp. 42_200_T64]